MTETEPSFTDGSLLFNPFAPGFAEDPYPQYEAVRTSDPVHESPLGFWLLARYDDCFRLLRDPTLSVDDRRLAPNPLRMEQIERVREAVPAFTGERRNMLGLDAPDHTRLRKLVSQVFTPRRVESLRPRIQAIVDDALDEAERRGEIELIGELAFPLPFEVISQMLGLPDHVARDHLRELTGTVVKLLDPVLDIDVAIAGARAGGELFDYLGEVIDWKRANPADDLLTAMIEAEDEGQMLTDDELSDQVALLFVAGHETTVNLIGNGTLALLRHRDQLDLLASDPSIAAGAVDELLRYDSPVQVSRRITTAPIEIGDRQIPEGVTVTTLLASANRDRDHWGDDADRLDLLRAGAGQHLSFGSGAHHCLGASLARLEGQVAIGSLVRRFRRVALASDDVTWNGRIVLRGLTELPLTVG